MFSRVRFSPALLLIVDVGPDAAPVNPTFCAFTFDAGGPPWLTVTPVTKSFGGDDILARNDPPATGASGFPVVGRGFGGNLVFGEAGGI